MDHDADLPLEDTGERMIPPAPGEISFVWERHRFAYEYARQFAHGKRVLDVGCGTGYGAAMLAEIADSVTAVDQDASAIAYCRRHFARPNVTYRVGDATALEYDQPYDLVLSFQVIEHVADPGRFLGNLKTAAAPSGVVLVTTPNVRNPEGLSENPFHFSEMNAAQLEALAREHFRDLEVLGVGYARPNRLRRILQRTPLYRLGRLVKRSSVVKRAADRAMDLRSFEIVHDRVHEEASDLLLCARMASIPFDPS